MARILILEDNQDLRMWFARELESDGHEVFQAARADEALEELESSRLDFVVLDVSRTPLDRASDLMQIMLRDNGAHLITDIGHNGGQAGLAPWAMRSSDLSRLKRRIREILAPSKLPIQATAAPC